MPATLPRRCRPSGHALIAAALALGALSCDGEIPFAPSLMAPAEVILVGAGDIAECSSHGSDETAALLDTIGGTVFTAGDNAYPNGSADDFRRCYEPTWGRFKARTRPSPGNHEYQTAGAAGYFDYFGANAGPRGLGYYRFTAGQWAVFSLNSNVDAGPGSAQAVWLRRELEGLQPRCLAAIWHHPIVSSGAGSDGQMRHIWQILHEFRAEVVISSHDHFYERFTPIDANGVPASNGIRLFIVGTGGAPLTRGAGRHAASEAWASVWGVLKLTLHPDSYQWAFVPVSVAAPIHDAGSGACR